MMGNSNLPPKGVRDSFFKGIGFELTSSDRTQAEWEEVDEEVPSSVTFPVAEQWLVTLGSIGEWMVYVGYGRECYFKMVY